MRIFFGFSCAELAQPRFGHHLAQQAIKRFGRKSHRYRQALFILGEGDHIQGGLALPGEVVKFRQNQGADQLAHPVGPEVETHQSVSALDQSLRQSQRFEEFVADL